MGLHNIFSQIMNMSLTASVIILFVLLFRQLIKKIPKVFSYVLWAVVLFRLICPVSFSSGLSLLGMFDTPTVESTKMTTSVEYVPKNVVYAEETKTYTVTVDTADVIKQDQTQPERKTTIDPMTVISCVWAVGVVGMLGYSLTSYIKLRRKLIAVVPLRDNIYLADHIESAFVMGLVKPKIYIPSSLSETEQEYIIMHEQHHIRRFDHIFKFLGFVVLCVHWFNPLVWVAFIQSGKDMEMSCDEAVIKKMGEGIRAEYSASLLSLTMGRRIIAGTPLAFSEGSTKHRIINLANWKRPKAWLCVLVAISCLVFSVACGTNPQSAAAASVKTAEIDVIEADTAAFKPIELVDDVVRPERNILFKEVETLYDFTSKVTADDIDLRYILFYSEQGVFQGYEVDIEEVVMLLNDVQPDEISEVVTLYNSNISTVELGLTCDDVEVCLIYEPEVLRVCFNVDYDFNTENPGIYNTDNYGIYKDVEWTIENEALNDYFNKAISATGGEDGPERVHLSEDTFEIAGEDIGKYYFTTDLDKIVVEIDAPDGFDGVICSESGGDGHSISITEMNGEAVYEILPTFSDNQYRIYGKDLAEYTITVSAVDALW